MLSSKEINEYNERRNKQLELKAKIEAQAGIIAEEIDKAIEMINEGLKKEGFKITVTKENFEEVYKKLMEQSIKDYAEGCKIMEEAEKKEKELV